MIYIAMHDIRCFSYKHSIKYLIIRKIKIRHSARLLREKGYNVLDSLYDRIL